MCMGRGVLGGRNKISNKVIIGKNKSVLLLRNYEGVLCKVVSFFKNRLLLLC